MKEIPLTHIRDDTHLAEALEVIDQLLQEELDEGSRAYLDGLTDLVENYEAKHVEIPDASEADVLGMLIESSGLSLSAMAREVGIAQSTLSAVLNGRRSLTKGQVIALAKFFHVAPGAFLPRSPK